jgi:hemoglobin-like flavoprotein
MDITTSMRALLEEDELILKRFYEKFLNQDPKVRDLFRDIDLDQQAVMLTTALQAVQLNYVANFPAMWKFLVVLGKKHAAIGAPKELYPKFRDCFLETLADYHGPDWDDGLESQWRAASEKAFKAMFEGYDTSEND